MYTSPKPAATFPAAVAIAESEDAQYLFTVVALVFSKPASKAETRAML